MTAAESTQNQPIHPVEQPSKHTCKFCLSVIVPTTYEGDNYHICPRCHPNNEIDFARRGWYHSCVVCKTLLGYANDDSFKKFACVDCGAYRCQQCALSSPQICIDGADLFPNRPSEKGTDYYFCDEKCKGNMADFFS